MTTTVVAVESRLNVVSTDQEVSWVQVGIQGPAGPAGAGGGDHGALTGLTDDDHPQHPLSAGRAGGQAISGGVAASETLTLQSTAHATKGKILFGSSAAFNEANGCLGVGTENPVAPLHSVSTTKQLQISYSDPVYATALVGSAGTLKLYATGNRYLFESGSASENAVYGAELLSSAGWSVGAGWVESPNDVFQHTSGAGTATLTHSAEIAIGTAYQVEWTITARTSGSITVALGGFSYTSQTASGKRGPLATSTAALTITPTNDFDGTLSVLSCKAVTGDMQSIISLVNVSDTAILDVRSSVSTASFGLGLRALRRNTTGSQNSAVGADALRNNTTGFSNTAIGSGALYTNSSGYSNTAFGNNALYLSTDGQNNSAFGVAALYSTTTGYSNSALGMEALRSNTTGNSNSAVGRDAIRSNTTGASNVGIGLSALSSNTTGSNCVAIGRASGQYQADGSTPLTDPENSVYLGYGCRGYSNADTNAIVIGYSAIGQGANTTVIGSSATVAATIYGAITGTLSDATANAIATLLALSKNSTGAGSAGLGARITLSAKTSTTTDTLQGHLESEWVSATHASRTARLKISAYDTAVREGIRLEASGSAAMLGFYGVSAVVRPAALTAQLTSITHTAPGTPNYALQSLTNSGGFGFATADEGHSLLAVVANLQTRVSQLETKLQALGLLT